MKTSSPTRPPSYLQQLLSELENLTDGYDTVVSNSTINNVDPITHGRGYIAIHGGPTSHWALGDDADESIRMDLLRRLREWIPRWRLMFPTRLLL